MWRCGRDDGKQRRQTNRPVHREIQVRQLWRYWTCEWEGGRIGTEVGPAWKPVQRLLSMSEKQHTVSESADKIRVKTKVKRGSGTRDQDEIEVKVKGDNPEDVVTKLNQTVAQLQETSDTLRAMQPENDE